ncbi:lanthionine synthetase C family protein [Streptomyces sp. NPDC059443]|uniref:lanthionine synthetase C family protein n=1 Tax=unclassified Streptomyces TaxID=2593676 RepID=UPI0036B17350
MRAAATDDTVLAGPLGRRARATAHLLATRLADPSYVSAAVAASPPDPNLPHGRIGSSLLAGDAGIALVLRTASRAVPESASYWAGLSRVRLAAAVRSTQESPVHGAGISHGTAGLALAVADSARDEPRYAGALDRLNQQLVQQIGALPLGGAVRDSDYDIVSGSAGVLGYLVSVPAPDPALRNCAHLLIDHLVGLCLPAGGGGLPDCVIPPEYYPKPEYRDEYPHGYVNLGLAHGLPGPLAALSLAWRAGYRRTGMATAIQRAAAYLRSKAVQDEFGVDWPNGIPLDPEGREAPVGPSARTAWCYGAPGIAIALLHASAALGDDGLRAYATAALAASLRRMRAADRLSPATLCHGLAGVLTIAASFVRATGSTAVGASLPWLTERLLDMCDADLPFGVQNSEPHHPVIDNPDLLVGAAGVAAALWSASSPVSHYWQRCLLIA